MCLGKINKILHECIKEICIFAVEKIFITMKAEKKDVRKLSLKAILADLFSWDGILDDKYVNRYMSRSAADDIRSDWKAVGGDMRKAMQEFDR